MKDFDVCIIGSGAGGGPVALTLAEAGYSVVVLEKGPWFRRDDFYKDELACCRRSVYTPNLRDEQHVIEEPAGDESKSAWSATPTSESGWDFWNGNCVGGSSNFMSGFFHRLKPVDFHQLSEFGAIEGANRVDWPISYQDLAPYYDKVEKVVGVSGKFEAHKNIEPRSGDFPYPPTTEHAISSWIDKACDELGYHSLRVPRAILSRPEGDRRSCEYSGYCGSYGCSSGAKGSSRAALLNRAVTTGCCEIRPHSKVTRLISDAKGKISKLEYIDANNNDEKKTLDARIYVLACQAIETSRLLLSSTGPAFPNGLANNNGQVGKNLLFSAGGSGSGDFNYADLSAEKLAQLKQVGPFVNRALDDWYTIDDSRLAKQSVKGGIVEFLFAHPNPTGKANDQKWDGDKLLWGKPFKRELEKWFTTDRSLRFEVFNDWLATENCFVSLDNNVKDRWGSPVAKVRIGYHPHDLKIARYLTDKGEQVLKQMGAVRINSNVSGSPPANLVAGGCRFGVDAKTSVLDVDCRAHEVENLFITDGSFMPTGGSVPYTWTIYANAFRVADKIKTL